MTTPDPAGKDLAVPRSGRADQIRTLLSGTIGTVPVVGSLMSAFMEVLWRPAYEKRVEAFLEMLIAELNKFGGRLDNLEELLQRDVAVSVGIAGARAASQTHDQTKLRYLANTVARVTVDPAWDEQADFALLLLQLVDDLTATHVWVLALTAGPTPWRERFTASNGERITLDDVFGQAFPGANSAMLEAILRDLHARGLVRYPADGTEPLGGPWNPTPSDVGRALLDFIQSPTSEQEHGGN